MPKRSSIVELANRLADEIVDEPDKLEKGLSDEVRHLIAVALGRQGGLKGGKARAAKLSAKRRKAIAKKAAVARWSKRSQK
jgi:hypothetical protein